ncbi:MAG: phosphatidate cytidylyltransferase [Gammaproteobacteria bacterium]|nr:MAG: phosphatidate cytidylyltransferase [Gammaproteobacteria bacterium]
MLWQRVLTALPLAILAVWFILTQSTHALFIALLLIILVSGWEWANLAGFSQATVRIIYALVLAVVVYATQMLITTHAVLFDTLLMAVLIWWCYVIYRMATRGPSAPSNETSLVKMLVGFVTLVPAVVAMVYIHAADRGGEWLLFTMSIIWVADIGAYFSGKRFGKTKLAPAISPGKTREGLYGALAATTIYTLAAAFYFQLEAIQILLLLIIAFFATLISVAGDLFISVLKRERGIKDSGRILPGHGGVLDRIDSLTSSAPFFALMLKLVIFNV